MMSIATTVKSRPILFSGPMIRAILDGRKVQTRRYLNPQPPAWIEEFGYTAFSPVGHISGRGYWPGDGKDDGGPGEKFFRCPYGSAGDTLWCRETWGLAQFFTDWETGYLDDLEDWAGPIPNSLPSGWTVVYRADGYHEDHPDDRGFRWRPSIHMPRWASRLTLRITEVRVERLTSISEMDAFAEGVEWDMGHTIRHPYTGPIAEFAQLWDGLNGDRPGCAWNDRPWVWVIVFERVEQSS